MNDKIRMPFGRHKGTLVADVPLEYLKWLNGTGNLRGPLSTAVKDALSWKHIPPPAAARAGGSSPPARSASCEPPMGSTVRSRGVSGHSPHREGEDLSQYITKPGEADNIPW